MVDAASSLFNPQLSNATSTVSIKTLQQQAKTLKRQIAKISRTLDILNNASQAPTEANSQPNLAESLAISQTDLERTQETIKDLKQHKWAASFSKNQNIWKCISRMYLPDGKPKPNLAFALTLLATVGYLAVDIGLTGGLFGLGLLASIGLAGGIVVTMLLGKMSGEQAPIEVIMQALCTLIKSEKMAYYHQLNRPPQTNSQPSPSV